MWFKYTHYKFFGSYYVPVVATLRQIDMRFRSLLHDGSSLLPGGLDPCGGATAERPFGTTHIFFSRNSFARWARLCVEGFPNLRAAHQGLHLPQVQGSA